MGAWIWDLGTRCSVYTVYVKSDILEELRRRRNDDLHFPERNTTSSTRKEQSALFNHSCSHRRVRKLKIFFSRQRDQMNFGPTLKKLGTFTKQ